MMKFIKDENGQGMLEYVLIIALVALVLIGVLIAINSRAKNAKDATDDQLNKVDDILTTTAANNG